MSDYKMLRHNTAQTITIPGVVDQTGLTWFTIGTVGDITGKINKNGTDVATLTMVASSPTGNQRQLTGVAGGNLVFSLIATDVDTLGDYISVNLSDPDAMVPCWFEGKVVPAFVFDSMNPTAAQGAWEKLWYKAAADDMGTAQAGSTTQITLMSGSSAVNNFYRGSWIVPVAGTGAGQKPRLICDYVGSTLVAQVFPDWVTAPSTDTQYLILGQGTPNQSLLGTDLGTFLETTWGESAPHWHSQYAFHNSLFFATNLAGPPKHKAIFKKDGVTVMSEIGVSSDAANEPIHSWSGAAPA